MSTHKRGRSWSAIGRGLALAVGGAATAIPLTALAECKYDLNGVGYPYGAGDVCPYRGPGSARLYVPQGPSPEELQRRAEEKDLAEAADDAEDRGERAYRNGDWAGAISDFKEALSYAPDDPVIATNLNIAISKWRDVQDAAKLADLKKAAEKSPEGQQLSTAAVQQPIAARNPAAIRSGARAPGSGSGTFGISANPRDPNLQGARIAAGDGKDTRALDQARAMAGTSRAGLTPGTMEAAAEGAGATPDNGSGSPGMVALVSVKAPRGEIPVSIAVANDPTYRALSAHRRAAQAAAQSAQKAIAELESKQQASTEAADKAALQIQISNETQTLQQAQSSVRVDEIKQKARIKAITYGSPDIVQAATTGTPAAKPQTVPQP
jgi:hypothetical protein